MNEKEIRLAIERAINQVRERKAMAASLTNAVTLEFVINAQIAIGGTPGSLYQNKLEEAYIYSGNAMSLNLGSFTSNYITSIPKTAQKLNLSGQNWVLDPVGIGVGDEREKLFRDLKNYQIPIIRGNASEIINLAVLWELAQESKKTILRGPDSTNQTEEAEEAAVAIAQFMDGVVVVTGEKDLVTNGKKLIYSHGGSEYLSLITGGGDSLTGVMAIYATVTTPFIAALTGIAMYNFAGKKAEEKANGPGTFKPLFIDELFNANAKVVAQNKIDVFEIKELE